jgi:hypothetical protein
MAEALTKAGVRRIYGVVGDSLNGFTDVLRRRKSIDWIHMRHNCVAFASLALRAAGLVLTIRFNNVPRSSSPVTGNCSINF